MYGYHAAVHMNKRKYGDPEIFRPERYLDQDGNFMHDNELLYFGSGVRKCPAEMMGRMEQYIVLTSLLQRFKFEWPDNKDDGPKDGYIPGLNMHPKPFKAKVTTR